MTPRSMRDVPVLEPLVRVAERLGEDLILFGSAASRAALLHAAERPPSSLLEIAEHGSDLDLAHTGPPALTPALRVEIERQVPLAPWLRWSITDRSGWLNQVVQERMNLQVPLRQVQLATHPALSEPQEEAIGMALDGVVTFGLNERFAQSPRANYDTEASGALLHLDAAIDAAVLGRQVGREGPLSWDREQMRQAIEAGAARLQSLDDAGRALAARRLWYRFAAVAMRLRTPVLDRALPPFRDLDPVMARLAEAGYEAALQALAEGPGHPLILSAALWQGGFRVDPSGEGVQWMMEGPEAPEAAFSEAMRAASPFGDPIQLAEGNTILAGIMGLRVRQGEAPSEGAAGILGQDFVHLSFEPDKTLSACAVDDLSALVIGRGKRGSFLLPAFAVVSRGARLGSSKADVTALPPGGTRTTIRLNLADMLDEVEKVDVFLLTRSERGER